jgi:hypothetical protein
MQHVLGSYALSQESAQRFGLEQLLEGRSALAAATATAGDDFEDYAGDDDDGEEEDYDDDVEEASADDKNVNNDEDDEKEEFSPDEVQYRDNIDPLVLIKTDTDLTLSTVMDAHEEQKDKYLEWRLDNNNEKKSSPSEEEEEVECKPHKVIYSAVGDVSARDVTVAKAARATILTYGVAVEKKTAEQLQKGHVTAVAFERLEDLARTVANLGQKRGALPLRALGAAPLGKKQLKEMLLQPGSGGGGGGMKISNKPTRRNVASD